MNTIFQKTKRFSRKQNSGRLHNPQEYATGVVQALNSSSKNSTPSSSSEQQVWVAGEIERMSTLMVGTQQVQKNKWYTRYNNKG
jgi:hypothetical protein